MFIIIFEWFLEHSCLSYLPNHVLLVPVLDFHIIFTHFSDSNSFKNRSYIPITNNKKSLDFPKNINGPSRSRIPILKNLINLGNDNSVVLIYSIFYNILFEAANYSKAYAYIYRLYFLSAFSAVKTQCFSPIVI